jgi:biotin transporter BioY
MESSEWLVTFSLPRAGNSFSWILEAEITGDVSGSSLSGSVGPAEFVGWFFVLCAGFLGVILIVGAFVVANSAQLWSENLLILAVPLAMIGFLFAFSELATRQERKEWKTTDEWLRRLLNASSDV